MSIKHVFKNPHTLLISLLILFIFVGLYRLDEIPSDWFGDISIVNNYVLRVIAGKWPSDFTAAGGPLYMYLVSPFIAWFGVSFLNYKILSVIIAALGLIPIYLFAKEIASKRIGLLTTFLTAFSLWYLIWARLGNYNIMTPIISALMMYFFVMYLKKHSTKWLALSIFASCLGLFTYAGVFLLPIVLLIIILCEMFIQNKSFDKKRLGTIALLYLPGLALFAFLVLHNWDAFINGYMGTKLISSESLSLQETISRIFVNAIRTLTMLHVEGDIVFRWNISKAPLIDFVSGIFFLIGFIYCILKEKKYLPYLLLPLFLLPLPSILPGHPPVEIPSSSRTMAIIPFVFLFVAYGIDYSERFIRKRFGVFSGRVLLVAALVLIFALNMYNYFVRYPKQLPNQNLSFAKVIATYVDSQPANVPVYFSSLGWGEWGQPSMDSIYYSLHNRNRVLVNGAPMCAYLKAQPEFIIILDPADKEKIDNYKTCFPQSSVQLHDENNQQVFTSIEQ